MRARSEIILSLVICVFLNSCSIEKNISGRNKLVRDNTEYIIQKTKEENISNKGFSIKNGRIETEGMAVNGEFSFTGKFKDNGDFMISVRGPFLMEMVRIIAVKDSIYMINRLNKVIYYGGKSKLTEKYRIPENIVSTFFGDLDEGVKAESCKRNETGNLNAILKRESTLLNITICSREYKVCQQVIENRERGLKYEIEYSKFKRYGIRKYPGQIRICQPDKKETVYIYIDSYEGSYSGSIDIKLPDYKMSPII